MTLTIRLEDIFSRFLMKTESYDLFDVNISDKMRSELLCSYARSAISEPFVRRLFLAVWLTEPYFGMDEDGTFKIDGLIEATFVREVDEYADEDFLCEILAYGMLLAWIEPKVNSLVNLKQFIGEADSKFYSQQTHLNALRDLRDDIEIKRNRLIDQRGTFYNDYLEGEALTATLRKTSATG